MTAVPQILGVVGAGTMGSGIAQVALEAGWQVRADRSRTPREIVLRIRSAIAAEAILARDAGVASEADIDAARRLGAVHPEGPFAWLRRHDLTISA